MISFTVAIVLLSLLHSTTGTFYYVTPMDDDYSTMDNNSVYILQHFVDNINEYFTSNTQLYLLPGEHNLNSDIIIQDVYNVSIIRAGTDTVIYSTINCALPAGIAIFNSRKVFLEKFLMLKVCK